MKKEVSVLLVPLGGEPVVRLIPSDVESSYEALSEFIGGSISSQVIAPRLQLLANEEGVLRRLPYNRCGFVGNIAIAKYSTAGNNISMTEKDVATALEWLARNDHHPPLCHVCGKPGGATMFCPCRDVLIYCVGCYEQCFRVMGGSDLKAKNRFALCPRCRKGN
jgi:hypothetical protein